MLIHPTVERLRALGLSAMADALVAMESNSDAADLPHADWLGLLIDREATARENRRLARRLQVAKPRQAASVENVDAPRPRPGPVPDARHKPVGARAPASGDHRPNRHGQELASLRARPPGVPGRLLRPLQARPPALLRTGPRPAASGALRV